MIAQMLIQEIKDLSMKASRQELEQSYFEALEKLSPKDLKLVRDSYLQEAQNFVMMPNFDHLY
jgi:hypothetical protein